jgi:nucleoside-diphosphate-sugar epimerase
VAGYVGSYAIRALKRRGHNLVVYDNFSHGHEAVVRGDIGDRQTLLPALPGVDADAFTAVEPGLFTLAAPELRAAAARETDARCHS